MRILVVKREEPSQADTGRSAAFDRLVAHLSERHRVRRVVGWVGERGRLPDDALGVDLSAGGWLGAWNLWRGLAAAARRFGPDVVLGCGVSVPRVQAPTVAVVRDLVRTGWEQPAAVQKHRIRRLQRIVVPTLAAARELRAAGARGWQIDVVPEPMDLPAEPAAPAAGPPFVLVHAGRILPSKGQHLSVDAVSRLLPEEKASVHLHVVGPIGDRRYYEQLRIAAVGQPISLHDGEEALTPWIRRAHLVLYPSCVSEGFADVALHAMAHGRPVVFADQPGVRESVGGVGLAVQPEDVASLRGAIRVAMAEPARLRDLSRRGRELVAARHSWPRLVHRWDEVLEAARRRRSVQ